jgi:cell division protease FtsH
MIDFEEAKDKVIMGVERRSMILSDEEKRNTAYHEAGHALLALKTEHVDPLHKVTIIPRGRALGLTQTLPIEDKHSYTRDFLEDQLSYAMGGRAAEALFFNHFSTGAGNDIERATDIARRMVCEWGMSEKIGPLNFGKKDDTVFLGREMAAQREISEKTAQLIDDEITRLVSGAYNRAKEIIETNRELTERLAETLLEREVLTGEEIDMLVRGEELPEKELPLEKGPRTAGEDEEPSGEDGEKQAE